MQSCLNPCFIGIYSLRMCMYILLSDLMMSLNPCFIGIYSLSAEFIEDCKRYAKS